MPGGHELVEVVQTVSPRVLRPAHHTPGTARPTKGGKRATGGLRPLFVACTSAQVRSVEIEAGKPLASPGKPTEDRRGTPVPKW